MTKATATIYGKEFYDSHEQGSLMSARIIVPILLGLINPQSVIDIGCGRGTWLHAFVENGITDIKGIDGDYVNQSKLLINPSDFAAIDLMQDFEIEKKYDLAVCLEVAEHLPHKRSCNLIHRLTEIAPMVLFSAAIPGQSGIGHINEQWPSYWRSLFAERGFLRLDPIRRYIFLDDRVEWWYRQNIFLFASESSIANEPLLKREQDEYGGNKDLEWVHISILRQHRTPRFMLQEIPKLLLQKIIRKII